MKCIFNNIIRAPCQIYFQFRNTQKVNLKNHLYVQNIITLFQFIVLLEFPTSDAKVE